MPGPTTCSPLFSINCPCLSSPEGLMAQSTSAKKGWIWFPSRLLHFPAWAYAQQPNPVDNLASGSLPLSLSALVRLLLSSSQAKLLAPASQLHHYNSCLELSTLPSSSWLPCHHPRPLPSHFIKPWGSKKNEEERKLNVSCLGKSWRRKTTTTINSSQGQAKKKTKGMVYNIL